MSQPSSKGSNCVLSGAVVGRNAARTVLRHSSSCWLASSCRLLPAMLPPPAPLFSSLGSRERSLDARGICMHVLRASFVLPYPTRRGRFRAFARRATAAGGRGGGGWRGERARFPGGHAALLPEVQRLQARARAPLLHLPPLRGQGDDIGCKQRTCGGRA